jgi:hypothetical protein
MKDQWDFFTSSDRESNYFFNDTLDHSPVICIGIQIFHDFLIAGIDNE